MRRYTLFFLLFLVLVAATRLPVIPWQLVTFDEVNMVYGMDKLDTRLSQPQSPGYPVFIFEMHVMRLLRFVRAEANLNALAILGSAASMTALAWCGDRMFAGWTGLYGALLLWLYPSFWYAGLNSALRVQLALISATVAASCWRAWQGDRRWVGYSALVLGLGSGIRPEVGPLLFPLWAVSVWRRRAGWKNAADGFATLVAAILCWLVPLASGSGGFVAYFHNCLTYLYSQSATTSSVFGLEPTLWLTNTILLAVWGFAGLLFLPMLLVLTRGAADPIGKVRWIFFALWVGPSLLFAMFVHVADPGHVLAMAAPVCLFMGHQVSRAASMSGHWRTPTWNWALPLAFLALAPLPRMIPPNGDPNAFRLTVLALSLVLAIAARFRSGANANRMFRMNAAGLILLPVFIFFTHAVFAGGWNYLTLADLSPTRVWMDVKYGFRVSSYQRILDIVNPDDVAIRALRKLVAEAPDRTVIVSEGSLTSWRKVSYYLPRTRLFVLEKVPSTPPRMLSIEWLRNVEKQRLRGTAPLTVSLPAGARVIWMTRPKTDFDTLLRAAFPSTATGPVSYTDLPGSAGSRQIGDYVIVWEKLEPGSVKSTSAP